MEIRLSDLMGSFPAYSNHGNKTCTPPIQWITSCRNYIIKVFFFEKFQGVFKRKITMLEASKLLSKITTVSRMTGTLTCRVGLESILPVKVQVLNMTIFDGLGIMPIGHSMFIFDSITTA